MLLLTKAQHARRWASESAQSSGPSNTLLYGGVGAAIVGGGAGYLYFTRGQGTAAEASEKAEQNVPAQTSEPSKIFIGGDQGFLPLALDKIEEINHNTKRFRFKFEDAEAVSGLTIASALVTKVKKEGDEKPTIKPYTPVSDEGEHST